jgi:hypothetical protein
MITETANPIDVPNHWSRWNKSQTSLLQLEDRVRFLSLMQRFNGEDTTWTETWGEDVQHPLNTNLFFFGKISTKGYTTMVSKVNGYSVTSSLFLIKISPDFFQFFFYLGSMSQQVGLLATFFILSCTNTSPINEKVVLGGSPLRCITNLENKSQFCTLWTSCSTWQNKNKST